MDIYTLFDCFAFSLAFALTCIAVLPAGYKAALTLFAICFIVVGAGEIFGFSEYVMLAVAGAGAFFLICAQFSVGKSILTVLSALLGETVFVMFFASLIVFYDPELFQTAGYNLAISIGLICYGSMFHALGRIHPKTGGITANRRLLIILVIMQIIVLLFISLIMPLSYNYMGETKTMFVYYLAFALLLLLVFTAFFIIQSIEKKRRDLEQQQEFVKAIEKITTEKHNEIIWLNHYFRRMYSNIAPYILSGNMDELAAYFHQYITPLHQWEFEHDKDLKNLELVKSKLLYNLFYDGILKIRQTHGRTVNLTVANEIYISEGLEIDLFAVVSEFMDNAADATAEQEQGIVTIQLYTADARTHIVIENTCPGPLDISSIYRAGFTTKEGHTGMGLTSVQKKLDGFRAIEHLNYIENNLFTQHLIIRND